MIFAGPHKSFTKSDNGMKTEMSNAVFFMREQVHENLEMESEKRCFSIITDMRYGTTINPYPITEEDLMDCNGEVPEQFEESLDDHEKLLDLLSESNTLCSVHSAQVSVQRFRDIRDEGLQGVHKAHAPIAKFRNALNDEELEDKLGFRCAECAKCLTCNTSKAPLVEGLQYLSGRPGSSNLLRTV